MHDVNTLKVSLDLLASSSNDDVTCRISLQIDSVLSNMKLRLDRKKYMQATVYEAATRSLCYEPDYTSIMMKVLRPGDTVIDIGANFGYFSFLASSLVTELGRVIALEPENENFAYLTRNIVLNNSSNIRALNVAAGNCTIEADLFIDPLNDGGHSFSGISPETQQIIGSDEVCKSKVQMHTLDSLIEVEKITDIKIIKIDTEGWEFQVIQGAISAIKRFSPPFILAEINRNGLRKAGASERYLRRLMAELGYSTYIASCLANGTLVLQMIPLSDYAEPDLKHYNYNAVFARPEALSGFSVCYHIFN
ncbi:MAG: FkbM family methyltransferase [Desulfuromonadaceae bacterium]|nr:FkbM family methyltransferase [Desulfuromonadaceae bacterium]